MAATIDPERAVAHLRRADPVMARVIEAVGPPRLRQPEASPFQALARSILFQQLSGRAASAILERFVALFDETGAAFPEPERVLAVDEAFLRSAGVSRAKAAAIHDLAAHFASGDLSPDRFDEWGDEEIIAHLTRVRGVGRWTAQMFLMFQLRRPDVLPVADAGLEPRHVAPLRPAPAARARRRRAHGRALASLGHGRLLVPLAQRGRGSAHRRARPAAVSAPYRDVAETLMATPSSSERAASGRRWMNSVEKFESS